MARRALTCPQRLVPTLGQYRVKLGLCREVGMIGNDFAVEQIVAPNLACSKTAFRVNRSAGKQESPLNSAALKAIESGKTKPYRNIPVFFHGERSTPA
jgi:hypothetical protein